MSTDASNDAFVFHPELVLFFCRAAGRGTDPRPWRIRRAASATGYEAREDFVFAEMPHDVPAIHDAALARQHRAHPLAAIAFGPQTTLGFSFNNASERYCLSRMAHIAPASQLLGTYIAFSIILESDGHSGTVAQASAPKEGNQLLLTNPHHA